MGLSRHGYRASPGGGRDMDTERVPGVDVTWIQSKACGTCLPWTSWTWEGWSGVTRRLETGLYQDRCKESSSRSPAGIRDDWLHIRHDVQTEMRSMVGDMETDTAEGSALEQQLIHSIQLVHI